MMIRSLILAGSLVTLAAPASAQWMARHGGHATALYVHQNTARGAERWTATTWWMGGLTHATTRRTLGIDAMITLDPVIHGECGYPRLLTDAGLCDDAPFEDRSMMHPLIMGLGGELRQNLGETTAIGLRVALAGEPAFGPTSYFMRASASNDAIMPLTHHALNPVHTAYGVITTTAIVGGWRAETSVYNGGPGDEDDYDLDLAPMHSYAGRLTYTLVAGVTAQASITSLQASMGGAGHHHGGAAGRMTAYSASLQGGGGALGGRGDLTLGWAAHRAGGRTTQAGLLEGQLERGLHTLFGRAELADRIEHEFSFINHDDGSHDHFEVPRRQRVTELTAGYALRLPFRWGVQPRIGVRFSTLTIPTLMRARYNAERGSSFAVFTSLRPASAHVH